MPSFPCREGLLYGAAASRRCRLPWTLLSGFLDFGCEDRTHGSLHAGAGAGTDHSGLAVVATSTSVPRGLGRTSMDSSAVDRCDGDPDAPSSCLFSIECLPLLAVSKRRRTSAQQSARVQSSGRKANLCSAIPRVSRILFNGLFVFFQFDKFDLVFWGGQGGANFQGKISGGANFGRAQFHSGTISEQIRVRARTCQTGKKETTPPQKKKTRSNPTSDPRVHASSLNSLFFRLVF